MPAALSVRVSAGCTGSGNGILTVELIAYPAGETVTVTMTEGSNVFTATFPPDTSPTVISGVANGTYVITASSDTISSGSVYVNNSSTVSLDREVTVNCITTGGGGGCDVEIVNINLNGTEATIIADGTGAIEYALDSAGPWQSSNVFTGLTPGIYTAYVRTGGTNACMTEGAFVVSAANQLAVTGPARDWLPVGLPIYYTFQSPDVAPEPLAVKIEVSANGLDFTDTISAGVIVLPPDSNGQYRVNVAPYLESVFEPGAPAIGGTDYKLFKLYRLLAGKLSVYDGLTGTPEIATPDAHALYATVLTPIIAGSITLSTAALYPSSAFNGIQTVVNVGSNTIANTSTTYAAEPNLCPKHPIQLYWLNRSGGWQTWVFDGKHEYGQDIPDPVEWMDELNRTHRASFGPITETVNVYSGFIPLSAYDTVFGILSAIRVFAREAGTWKEVNLETGSYQRHKAGQRRKELNFSFTYAESLTVQNA